jgi:hypothetical protein
MEAAGFILAGILGVISVVLFKAVASTAQENMQLKQALMKYEANKFLYDINNLVANMKTKAAPPKLQKQTEQLLVLAVRSNNENESRAAAVQACKRIHKELGIK